MASQDISRATRVSTDAAHRPTTSASADQDADGARTATNSPDNVAPFRLSKSSTAQGKQSEISQLAHDYDKRASTSDGRKASNATTFVNRRTWDRQPELIHTGGLGIVGAASDERADQTASGLARDDAAAATAPNPYGRYDDAAHPASSSQRRDPLLYDEEGQYEEFLEWKRRQQAQTQPVPARIKQLDRARTLSYGQGHHPQLHAPRVLSHKTQSDSTSEIAARMPYLNWMGWTAKGHLVAFFGEFVGTTMFLFFAFAGSQAANVQPLAQKEAAAGATTGFNAAVLLYVSLVFGFSLMINVWVFYRVSGGLFNPAVTFAMLLVRVVTPFRALLLFIAQLVGSILASFLVKVIFPTTFSARTSLSVETSLIRGVFIEAILTAELVFTIFMLAKEKHKATFIAPIGIGLALFIAELVGVYYTGGSLNPARSFGPCVVTGSFNREHWIYWAGPAMGAIIAVVIYKFILMMQYELANPGQDESSERRAAEAAEEAKAKAEQLEEKTGRDSQGARM